MDLALNAAVSRLRELHHKQEESLGALVREHIRALSDALECEYQGLVDCVESIPLTDTINNPFIDAGTQEPASTKQRHHESESSSHAVSRRSARMQEEHCASAKQKDDMSMFCSGKQPNLIEPCGAAEFDSPAQANSPAQAQELSQDLPGGHEHRHRRSVASHEEASPLDLPENMRESGILLCDTMEDNLDGDGEREKIREEVWNMLFRDTSFQEKRGDWYVEAVSRYKRNDSHCLEFLGFLGVRKYLPEQRPTNMLARFIDGSFFATVITVVIAANTAFLSYEAEFDVKAAMGEGPRTHPAWFQTCESLFIAFFVLELCLRLLGFGTWFFVGTGDWYWNVFDAFSVLLPLLTPLFGGSNLGFLRVPRVLRILHLARIIRVFRMFRELREIFLSIISCLASLAWAFVFMALIMLVFSIFFLQGGAHFLEGLNEDADKARKVEKFAEFYGSLGCAMLSLLAAVTGGEDWMNVREPLIQMDGIYSSAFVLFVLFIIIGVMNILTGVFVQNAASINDRDISVHKETEKLECFVHEMISLFHDFDLDSNERITWKSFKRYLNHPTVQAYLASLQLEATHGFLLFDLLDHDRSGSVDAYEFVIGMMRLRGNAKALDARLLERDLDVAKHSLNCLEESFERLEDGWKSGRAQDFERLETTNGLSQTRNDQDQPPNSSQAVVVNSVRAQEVERLETANRSLQMCNNQGLAL